MDINNRVAKIQSEILFPWTPLSLDFPSLHAYFQLISTREKTTPEGLFFSLACSLVCIASERGTISNGIRNIVPRLWIIGFNRSGTGKSAAMKPVMDGFSNPILNMADRIITEATPEGLLKSLSDTESRFLIIDELHQFFHQCGCGSTSKGKVKPYASQMLSLFSNNPIIKRTAGSSSKVTLYSPKLVFLGNIQSSLLVSTIIQSPAHRETGFFSRFNYYTSSYKRYTNSESAKANLDFQTRQFPEIINILSFVSTLCKESSEFHFEMDLPATSAYNEWESNLTELINVEPQSLLDSEYRNILQKTENNVLIFAMVFWFLELSLNRSPPSSKVIRERHIRAGILVAKYLVDQHFELLKICLTPEGEGNAKSSETVLFVVNNCENLTYRQMYRSEGMNEAKINSAIQTLKNHGVGRLKYFQQKGRFFVMEEQMSEAAKDFLRSVGYGQSGNIVSQPSVPFEEILTSFESELPSTDVHFSQDDPHPIFETDENFINGLFGPNE